MASTQLVLLGVPAFVGSVTGPTTIAFTIDEAIYGPPNLISVDLAKNTSLPPAQWATVDVDKQTTGGYTTIGPTFNNGQYVGAVYLADRLVTTYKTQLAAWPPPPDARYQYQALLRADEIGNVTRYHGFKVQVASAAVGSLIEVLAIPVGSTAPVGIGAWIDLSDAGYSDPKANGFTTIDATSPVGTVGALFLSAAAMEPDWPPGIPKIPHFLGT